MTLKTIFLFAIIATLITLAFSEEKSYKDRLESFITENENKLEDLTPENLAKIRNLATSVDAYKKLVSNPFFNREQQQSCFNWHGKYCGPGFCDNKYWDNCNGSSNNQKNCNTNGSYEDDFDLCCRMHDRCCIDKRSNKNLKCDTPFINCMNNIKVNTLSIKGFTKALLTDLFFTFFKGGDC